MCFGLGADYGRVETVCRLLSEPRCGLGLKHVGGAVKSRKADLGGGLLRKGQAAWEPEPQWEFKLGLQLGCPEAIPRFQAHGPGSCHLDMDGPQVTASPAGN